MQSLRWTLYDAEGKGIDDEPGSIVMMNYEREKEYLQWKLAQAGFQFFSSEDLNAKLVEETVYALNRPPHERRSLSYGALLVTGRASDIHQDKPKKMLAVDLIQGRELADGKSSFVVRCGENASVLLVPGFFGEELGGISLRDDYLKDCPVTQTPTDDIGVVQRTDAGDVRVFGPRNIAIRRGHSNSWATKNYKYSYVEGIHRAAVLARAELSTIRAVASLCVHGLSDRGVGATVIIGRTEEDFADYINLAHTVRISGIFVDDFQCHYALMTLLAQKDGATLVRNTGEVAAVGVRLTATAQRKTPSGMRHASAMEYSTAHRDCIVMVVSEDGKVTVYLGGVGVNPLDWSVNPATERIICGPCSMEYTMEPIDVTDRTVCPLCETAFATSVRGYALRPYCPLPPTATNRAVRVRSSCGGEA